MTRVQLTKQHDDLTEHITKLRKRLLRLQLKQAELQRQIASTPKQ